ncbi:hypothetical protein ACWDSJ_02520 [Nocardia sp. NPDC003482]
MGTITAPRFEGLRQFGLCLDGARMTEAGFDSDGNLVVDEPNDADTVFAVQEALTELGFAVAASGVYDADTAEQVRLFKNAQNLALPPGLVAHDGVLGPGTSKRLNEIFTPPDPVEDPELRYTDRKSFYTNRALANANDANHLPWDPDQGFAFNRPRIVDLYAYYRDLYLRAPTQFLWAGLGRMAGGAVVGGLDADPGFTDQAVMVRIGRDIFFDLAWQHEAFLDDPGIILELADLHDRFNRYPRYDANGPIPAQPGSPRRSYRAAWEKILTGTDDAIAAGNRDLLENEQFSIIQPHYDFLRTHAFAGLPTPFVNEIHPYHRAFIIERPQGDILVADDRWSWISDRMWTNWVAAGVDERSRLVRIPLERTSQGDFGVPGRPDLLPPGGP